MKDFPAKSGAEASDESILKKDSDKAKAMFAAHVPRSTAVFWSKYPRPTAPTGAVKGALKKDIPAAKSGAAASFDETGAIKIDPALKPVTEDAQTFLPVATGGAPLPSIKELPAASAAHSAPRVCQPTPSLAPRFHCT